MRNSYLNNLKVKEIFIMEKVSEVIKNIKATNKQTSASKKDEVAVMQAMLNDKEYKVGVYANDGSKEQYCPSDDARAIVSSVVCNGAKIGKEEAAKIADDYTFSKAESTSFIGISKEFVNTYVETGRKLPLGARENSNVALSKKEVGPSVRSYPKKSDDGVFEHPKVQVPGYQSIRVHGSCPNYVK
jgi:hypothetical protein